MQYTSTTLASGQETQPEQGQVAQVASLFCFRVLMCTGVARKLIGKGVVGVHGDLANSRSYSLEDAREEHGAGMCHNLARAQGGDMWPQQQWAPLCWFPDRSSAQRSVPGGLPCSAQGPSPGRAEDAWTFPEKAIKE